MSRLFAASVHLLICASIGLALWLLLIGIWYPSPLFDALGGGTIFLMLLGIDVVLGPLLTLIVWKEHDQRLKVDLAIIGCIQVAALAYGVHTLWVARPVYVVALGHRYDLLQANDIEQSNLDEAQAALPKFGPVWVGVRDADDPKERQKIVLATLTGQDYGHFPKYHVPVESMATEVLTKARPIAELKRLNPEVVADIDRWLRTRGHDDHTAVFQGLRARAQDMAVVMDAKTAKVIGVAPFRPWP